MPYIKVERREIIDQGAVPQNAGELNYAITDLIRRYLVDKPTSYQRFNDVLGALEGAKLELYARKVRPYEDQKIKENGDIL
jgi:hypothetical protein